MNQFYGKNVIKLLFKFLLAIGVMLILNEISKNTSDDIKQISLPIYYFIFKALPFFTLNILMQIDNIFKSKYWILIFSAAGLFLSIYILFSINLVRVFLFVEDSYFIEFLGVGAFYFVYEKLNIKGE